MQVSQINFKMKIMSLETEDEIEVEFVDLTII